jgi:hypothetical protein
MPVKARVQRPLCSFPLLFDSARDKWGMGGTDALFDYSMDTP